MACRGARNFCNFGLPDPRLYDGGPLCERHRRRSGGAARTAPARADAAATPGSSASRQGGDAMKKYLAILLLSAALSACSSAEKLLEGVTGEKDTVLPGTREDALGPSAGESADPAEATDPIVLPV